MTTDRKRNPLETREVLESSDFAASTEELPPSTQPADASKLARALERQRRHVNEPAEDGEPSARRLSSAGVTVVLSESFDVASPSTRPAARLGVRGDTPSAESDLSTAVADGAPPPLPVFVPARERQRLSSEFPGTETPTLKTNFAPAQESSFVDEQAGRYTYLRRVGTGGISEVLVVRDESLGREVAFKQLDARPTVGGADSRGRPEVSSQTTDELRFVAEARITGRLEHAGIVPVYELGRRRDARLYYTMRVARGRTLKEALTGSSFGDRMKLLPRFLAACQAVAYAHERGIVHRALTPDHVLLGEFGETFVVGWGLARARGERDVQAQALADTLERFRGADGASSLAEAPGGACAYMAPEQARGELEAIDERSDVFALGAMLYQLLTGAPPFAAIDPGEVIRAVQERPVRPPTTLEPKCPAELAAVALRALEKLPERRYADARCLASEVDAFLAERLVGARRCRWGQLLRRWLRRCAVLLAVGLGLIAVASAGWWYRGAVRREQLAREEARRAAEVREKIDRIIADFVSGKASEDWLSLHSHRLMALEEPMVEARLIALLGDENADVRRLAARALGGMKSKVAVDPLIARLEAGVEPSSEAKAEVISALAVIGDPRAPIR